MTKKQSKSEINFEIMLNAIKWAKLALKNGFGPAHNSNKDFGVIPGKIEDNAGYAIIVEKGKGPVDWYAWSAESSGFGGWHNYDYNDFIRENPWIEEEWESLKK